MSEDGDKYLLLENSDKHMCFGCSPKNEAGLKMVFYANEKRDAVVSWLSIPDRYCGWGGLVHGGIVSTILDEAMGWGALVLLRRLVLSKNINVDFVRPVFIGQKIRVEGSVQDRGNDREAVMKGCIYNDKNDLCAQSSSAVSLFTVESLRSMNVVDNALLDDLERMMNNW